MRLTPASSAQLRIGSFEVDLQAGELHTNGLKIRLQDQPLEILAMLVDHPGEIVPREELRLKLWPADTFVDFEHGLNRAINKLRAALGDDAAKPRYIETLPRRGYRLIAPVEVVPEGRRGQNGTGNSLPLPTEDAGVVHELAQRKGWIWASTICAAGIIVAAIVLIYLRTHPWPASRDFDVLKLERLTTSGKVGEAVISPDGKYLAYIEGDAGKESLWLRQMTAASRVRVAALVDWDGGLSFSPDGGYLYYVRFDPQRLIGVLYSVPVLGGEPKKVTEDVDSPPTFSPDGKRMAFGRGNLVESEYQLIIAKADGTREKRLAGRKTPGYMGSPDWSPDGRLIAVAAGSSYQRTAIGVKEDGSEVPLTTHDWPELWRVVWLRNGEGLVMTAREQPLGSSQIWLLEYPSGRVRRVTNDLSDYGNEERFYEILSVTADSKTLVTIQSTRVSNVWIAPTADLSHARRVTSMRNGDIAGLAWTPDSKIVYASNASGGPDLWIMEAGGNKARQVTTEPSAELQPTVSPDGRYIVFVSDRTGTPHLWRTDAEGSNPRQLTNGSGEMTPQFSPDGNWVVYARWDPRLTIWKVPIEGGHSLQLTEKFAQHPTVSPDGRWIACAYLDDPVKPWKLAVIPVEGGLPDKLFAIAHGTWRAGIRWAPDGRAIAYARAQNGVSNIWLQPLTGGPPKQLTHFDSDLIFDFAWSPDGKQLALSRGNISNDAVLIKNFQ